MPLSLHTIKPAVGSTHRRKRLGRGNASGHGSYSTRGVKGQKARSGVTGLARLGMKKQLLAIPKKRGFRSLEPKAQAVALDQLNLLFKDKSIINPTTLLAAGLVKTSRKPVKFLAPRSEFTLKDLQFSRVKLSATALAAAEKNGCKIIDGK